jgi:hypothetical protein
MKIDNYPYGKPTKTLRNAVTWLNLNRRRIEKRYCREYAFDYPFYWDMPKKFSSRLTSDQVDWIQEETYDWNFQLTEHEYNETVGEKE